jgi:hypothetical protein
VRLTCTIVLTDEQQAAMLSKPNPVFVKGIPVNPAALDGWGIHAAGSLAGTGNSIVPSDIALIPGNRIADCGRKVGLDASPRPLQANFNGRSSKAYAAAWVIVDVI